jgi:drug/metabolite transporter (DMT)-like permease
MKILSPHSRGMLFLTGAFALAGTSVISARFVAGKLGTFTITAVSLFFALLLLVPLAGSRIIESIRGASARDWAYLFLQALFGIFLFRVFLLLGLLHTTSVEAGILTGATPAITAVLSGLLLKEKMGPSKIIGILSTVAGVLFIQGLFMPGKCFMPEHIIGNVLVLCAASCESIFNVCSRIAVVRARPADKAAMPPMVKTVLVSLIAMSLCLIPACFEQPVGFLAKLGLQDGFAYMVWSVRHRAGVSVLVLGNQTMSRLYRRCLFRHDAVYGAAVVGFDIGEHAAIQQWCGGILIISGMALIGRERNKLSDQEAF